MQTTVLNYRIVIEPDKQTGTGKSWYTAYCPSLGVADDGKTVEEAIKNIRGAIEAYVQSLSADKLPVPVDEPQHDIITTTQILVRGPIEFAQ